MPYKSVLQRVAVWCGVLQCVALGGNVLQCVAVSHMRIGAGMAEQDASAN